MPEENDWVLSGPYSDKSLIRNVLAYLNSTLKCNSKIGCEKSGAAVGFVLFPPSKMRSTNETLQPAHAGTKIHNKYYA
jgi:hypothetical protein